MTQKLTPAALFIEDYELITWMKDNNITGNLMCELIDEIIDCIVELTTETAELDCKFNSTNSNIRIGYSISDGRGHYTYDFICPTTPIVNFKSFKQ